MIQSFEKLIKCKKNNLNVILNRNQKIKEYKIDSKISNKSVYISNIV